MFKLLFIVAVAYGSSESVLKFEDAAGECTITKDGADLTVSSGCSLDTTLTNEPDVSGAINTLKQEIHDAICDQHQPDANSDMVHSGVFSHATYNFCKFNCVTDHFYDVAAATCSACAATCPAGELLQGIACDGSTNYDRDCLTCETALPAGATYTTPNSCAYRLCDTEVLLFEDSSNSNTGSSSGSQTGVFDSEYSGWYNTGSFVTSGDGKRAPYDMVQCSQFKFEIGSSSGTVTNPDGKTSLLALVQSTGKNQGSSVNSQASGVGWKEGHKDLQYVSRTGTAFGSESHMTLIQSDGSSSDAKDWVTFSFEPTAAESNGDWGTGGANYFAFGHEFATHMEGAGTAKIYGVDCDCPPPTCDLHTCTAGLTLNPDAASLYGDDDSTCCYQYFPPFLLFEDSSNSNTGSSSGSQAGVFDSEYSGWYNTGGSVTSGDGKRQNYDDKQCNQFKFEIGSSSGTVAAGTVGRTSLLALVQSTGKNQGSSVNSQASGVGWKEGHKDLQYVSRTGTAFGSESHMTLIQSDGSSSDAKDWVTFSFEPTAAESNGDWGTGAGANYFAFGHEFATHMGGAGTARIYGLDCI